MLRVGDDLDSGVFGAAAGARGGVRRQADVTAAAIALQAMHGLSYGETAKAATYDLQWKAACALPIKVGRSIRRR